MIHLDKVLPINLRLVDGKKVPIGGMKKTNVVDYVPKMKNFAIHLSDYPDIVVLDLDTKEHKLDFYKDLTYTHKTRKGWHCFFKNTYGLTQKRQKQAQKFDLLAGENWVFFNYDNPAVATYKEYNGLPLIDMPPALYDLVKTKARETGETIDVQFITEPLMSMLKSDKHLWDGKQQRWNIDNSSDLAWALTKELMPYTTDPAHIKALLVDIPEVSEKHTGRLLEGRVNDSIAKLSMERAIVWRPLSDFRAISIGGKTRYADIDRNEIVNKEFLKLATIPGTKIDMIEEFLRIYPKVEFNPALPNKFSGDTYNLFNGFIISEEGEGHKQYLDYIYNAICSCNDEHYEYLLNYMAHMVQKPSNRPDVAIVLFGHEKGTGKDTLHQLLGHIFKKGGYTHLTEETLMGRFNVALETCVLGVAEELVFGGSHREDSKLKSVITAPVHMIERKGHESYTVDNFLRLIVTSNSSRPVRATDGERRYFALKPSTIYKDQFQFWDELYTNFQASHLLYFLQQRDITGFNPRNFPASTALIEIINQNKDRVTEAVEFWWAEAKNEDFIDMHQLYEVMVDDKKYMTHRQFSRKFFSILGKDNFRKTMTSKNGVTTKGYKVIKWEMVEED